MTSYSSTTSSHRDMLVDEVTDRLRLESQIVGERWMRLKEATIRVQNHKDAYRRECSQIGEEKKSLEVERNLFESDVKAKWPAATLTEDEQMIRIVLNIGGRRFESTAEVLTKDRFSVLAALCTANPPVKPDTSGAYFFDRDGELFQHCINFLRDGVLPDNQEDLRSLYTESSFFRLGSLRCAVERKFDQILADAEHVARNRNMMTMNTNNQNIRTMNNMMTTRNNVMNATTASNRGTSNSNTTKTTTNTTNNTATGSMKTRQQPTTSMMAAQAGGAGIGAYMNMGGMPGNMSMSNFMGDLGNTNPNIMGRTNTVGSQQRLQSTSLPDPYGFTSSVPNNMMTMQQQRRAGMGSGGYSGIMGNTTMNNTMLNSNMNGMMNNNTMRSTTRDDFGI
jgi:hypothetical protein